MKWEGAISASLPVVPRIPSHAEPTRGMAWTDLGQRRALIAWGLVLAAAVVVVAAAQVWLRLQLIDLRYRLGVSQEVWSRLDAEHEMLLATLARLEDPARLETVARQRLGLVRPVSGQEVYLP